MKSIILSVLVVYHLAGLQAQSGIANHAVLQSYLPTAIPGYLTGVPESRTVDLDDITFSSAKIEFENRSGNYIRISLFDFSMEENMYRAAIALWETGLQLESDETYIRSLDWGSNFTVWEEFRSTEKIAIVALGIVDRFFLTIEADNQKETGFVKTIAQNMSLDRLSEK
jgi:hypothetical protein